MTSTSSAETKPAVGDSAEKNANENCGSHTTLTDEEYCRMIGASDLSNLRNLLQTGKENANRKVRHITIRGRTTGLHLASSRGRLETVQLLLEFGADSNGLDDSNRTPLYAACTKAQVDTARELIKRGADVDRGLVDRRETPLYAVCSRQMGTTEEQQCKIVSLLISAQADVNLPDRNGLTPLCRAVMFFQRQISGLLIKAMADVDFCHNETGDSIFHIVSQHFYDPMVEDLVRAGCNPNLPNRRGATPIYTAVALGNDRFLRAIIDAGANADWPWASQGVRPLHLAATQKGLKQSNAASMLIKSAIADINAKQGLGATPLLLAAETGNLKVLDTLIRAQADVDLQTPNGSSPIRMAAQNGWNPVVKRLIAAQANVNATDDASSTPLLMASQNGHFEVVSALLAANADTDVRDFYGSLPLQHACQHGRLGIAMALLRAQSDVSALNPHGFSPIYLAAQGGQTKLVNALVAAQADVDYLTDKGISPTFMAAQNGHLNVIDTLIKAQADVNLANKKGISPLYTASEYGHHLAVELLLSKGQAFPDCTMLDGYSPLHVAAQNGHVRIVDHLIAGLATIDCQDGGNHTPVYIASQNGHNRVVTSLLDAGADCNLCSTIGTSPLYITSQVGHARVAQELIEKGCADLDLQITDGSTALHAALRNNHIEVADSLIKAGANVNLQQLNGMVPLHLACKRNQLQVVESLIKAQACLDLCISEEATALHIASYSGHTSIVGKLIREGADVNALDVRGDSPLHSAAQLGHTEVASLLVNSLADTNQQNRLGVSPMHMAADNGRHAVIGLLVEAMADVNVTTLDGVSPLHIASMNGHTRVVKQLIEHGARVDHSSRNGNTALFSASTAGNHQIVALLIAAQADVNHQALDGRTPLFAASRSGHLSVSKMLVAANADVDLQSDIGWSPLFAAIQNGHQSVVEELIFRGLASASVTGHDGFRPLQVALRSGESHTRVAVALIGSADIDVDARGDNGESALHVASREGFNQVAEKLIATGSDINLQTDAGCTPIYLAAQHGRDLIVSRLVKSMADADLPACDDSSPMWIAAKSGHTRVAQILARAQSTLIYRNAQREVISDPILRVLQPVDLKSIDREASTASMRAVACTDRELSIELNLALTRAGFHKDRSALQSSVADVLQKIIRQRRYQSISDDLHIVGSFSEGWGNSLTRVDGRIDPLADIDIMELIPGRLYHPKGLCKCSSAAEPESVCDYSNGHISCAGFASNPAASDITTPVRPAFDFVPACRLCCYPTIAPLLPARIAKSNISKQVLESLKQELQTSQCHVVHASAPGMSGKQLRVSTTFLERHLLRNLNTIQGQLFVTLKYLVKKVISTEVQGVKAYHVKTVTFRMVERTPAKNWKAENLVRLIRQSLTMLMNYIEKRLKSKTSDGRIMPHFFLKDAALYLKGSDRSSPAKIVLAMRSTLTSLPQKLKQFISNLKPLDDAERFHFHPFVLLPHCTSNPIPEPRQAPLEFHEIYDVVKQTLQQLAKADACQQLLDRLIDRLTDCARSTRETLRVLTCLKFGQEDDAIEILRCWNSSERQLAARKGIVCQAPFDVQSVWKQLTEGDSAWRFYFSFEDELLPVLGFLPGQLANWFPLNCESNADCYVNFRALMVSLQHELLTPAELKETSLLNDDSGLFDMQELLVTLRYNKHLDRTDMQRLKSEHVEDIKGNQLLNAEWCKRTEAIAMPCIAVIVNEALHLWKLWAPWRNAFGGIVPSS